MTNKERSDALQQAAAIVQSVADTLNVRAHECPTCSLRKAESWGEAKIHEEISAIVVKLQKNALFMLAENKEKQPRNPRK